MVATGVIGSDPSKLDVAGGTMLGQLVLDDASPAASEEYVADHGGGGGGGGSVDTVNGIDPDGGGNVTLDAADVGALAAASNLSDLANAATARTNLGLGTAAMQASSAFDSAGDATNAQSNAIAAAEGYADTGDALALKKASNLSDLANSGTARTNLGLGGSATLNVGSTAGTVAAGDDSRIAGAAQKASNLSDLASASTARTNLGLGGAAVLNVGTGTGTVAAGNDTRLSDTRTPTDNSVTSAKIADGAIVNADINAAAAIVLSKLATDPLARANHTGTQTASTISDFTAAVNALYGTFADMASLGTNVALGTPHLQSRTEPGSIVRLQGQLSFTGTATGTLFTLPVGQRPPAQVMIEQRTQVTAVQVIILINTDGTVTTGASIGATALLNFDDVTFVHA